MKKRISLLLVIALLVSMVHLPATAKGNMPSVPNLDPSIARYFPDMDKNTDNRPDISNINGTGTGADYIVDLSTIEYTGGSGGEHIPHGYPGVYTLLLSYGNVITLGNMNLGDYSACEVTYATDLGYVAQKEDMKIPANFSLKSNNVCIGCSNQEPQTDGLLAQANCTDVDKNNLHNPNGMNWDKDERVCYIDLTNVDYSGEVWLSHFNATGNEALVSKIRFVANSNDTPDIQPPVPSDPSYQYTGPWAYVSGTNNIGIYLRQEGDYAAAIFEADAPFSAIQIPKYWASNNERTLELDLYTFTGSLESSLTGTPVASKEFSAKANNNEGVYVAFPEVGAGVYVICVKLNSVVGSGYFSLPGEGNKQIAEYYTTDANKTFNFGIGTTNTDSAFGTYIGITIPDQALRNYVFENVDFDDNYMLSAAEKAAVTSMTLNGLGISSLKGLDLFDNLISLTCTGNNISEIDLSGIRQLEYLDCSNNNIVMIDISACPNLVDAVINGEMSESDDTITYTLNAFGLTLYKNVVIHTGDLSFDQFVMINEENFPDEWFRNFVTQFDLDGSGSFDFEELAAVNSIYINYYYDPNEIELNSIAGIEYFFNLEELNICCEGIDSDYDGTLEQNVINLDATDLSRNKKLTSISAFFVVFESLNIDNLNMLKRVDFTGSGSSELDFSKTPNIETILLIYAAFNTNHVIIGQTDSLKEFVYWGSYGTVSVSYNLKLIDIFYYGNKNSGYESFVDWGGVSYPYQVFYYGEDGDTSFTVGQDITIELKIPVDETVFPDDAFFGYISENVDTNGDNFLDFDEFDAVQSISVENVNDLTGMELFRNLILLDCSGSSLSALDLSHNQKLANAVAYGQRTESDGIVTYSYEDAILMVGSDVDIYTGIPYYDNRIIINEANFPDANFREFVKSFDLNGDGGLVQAELDTVTEIVADGLGIESLVGIEFFTNLTSLSLSGNSLTEFDFAAFPNLTYLNLSGNLIENLDLSSHTGFAEAVAYGTRTVIDESVRNEKDGFVLITDSNVALYTGIPYYDDRIIINEANFPDANFREFVKSFDLNGDGGFVQAELDAVTEMIAADLEIESLNGIEFFTNLSYLDCSENLFEALDISFNQGFAEAVAYGTRTVIDEKVTFEKDGFVLITDSEVVFHTGIPGYDDRLILSAAFFPDEIFREYLRVFDLNGDGALTDHEVELVTEINVDGLSVSSLKGIEFFANLQVLSCRDNNLEALDIGANVLLEELHCEGNAIASIFVGNTSGLETVLRNAAPTSIDGVVTYSFGSGCISASAETVILTGDDNFDDRLPVDEAHFPDANFRAYIVEQFGLVDRMYLFKSEYTTLEYMDVNSRNIATLRGIEYFTGLKTLYCNNNQLAELDLSGNMLLETLFCNNNQLAELDLSGNMLLEALFCYDNQLTVLDLPANTSLKVLYCNNNQLTELTIANYLMLIELNCANNRLLNLDVSTLSELAILNCGNNIFTTLDLSGKTKLRSLICFSEFLETLIIDGCASLTSFNYGSGGVLSTLSARNCTSLDYLNCYQNQLRTLIIDGCKELSGIEISNNNLTELDLSGFDKLVSVRCENNNIGTLSLDGCTSLQNIYASDNKIKNIDITGCVQLRNVSFWNNRLSLLDISECTYLRNNYLRGWGGVSINGTCTVYTGVEVNEQNFPDAIFRNYVSTTVDTNGSTILSRKELNRIESIDLMNAGISSFEGLKHLDRVVSLRVTGNPIDTLDLVGLERLAVLICQDTNVTELEISDCPNLVDAYVNGTVSSESTTYITYDSDFGYLAINRSVVISMGIPIDAEHFPDDNFRSYVRNAFDLNTNGYLGQTERDRVKNIEIYGKGIVSIEGISYFKNTTYIYCPYNQISEMDLSDLTELTALHCDGNLLTALDLSANKKLVTLSCNHNAIVELDLSHNTELNSLSCYGNGMTKLAILNCYKLIEAIREGEKTPGDEYDYFYYNFDGEGVSLWLDKTLKISTGKEPAYIYSLSSTLNGTVEMNAYFVLPDFILEDSGAYVKFAKDGKEKIVMVADVLDSTKVIYGALCYKFSNEIVAKEFHDIVNVKLFDSTGRSIQIISYSGVDYGTDGYPYPLSRYLQGVEKSPDENMRNLARAMLDYGSAAQLYFNYNVDDSIVVTNAVSSIQYSEFDPYESVKSDDADKPDGFVSNQFSLVLEGDTALKMYYVFDAGYDPFSYQYYIDGEAAVLHKDGSKYYLVVENIVAKKLDIAHEFTISDGNKSYSIISSALSYARSLAGLSDTNKQNLGKAILLYNRMAKDYFNSLSN